ncbi:MAG: hypothetical protein OMM_07852 [Candidatus Magnetoglobus multicellularis str. Araruama]|uniref:TonB-dependent receptor-like beta-barrel domain-containing protein n=1 Tax=Candidatus Magnetoglobus multicellularis str. Araruama TaxID=890399 RepID=A0A1V1PAM7_9BACT|nr:MAG: hypothetical protein OMM_07852 [Candidatus Magnetoglobus multicellularis str. Araruama]
MSFPAKCKHSIFRFAAIYQLTDNHIFKLLYGKAIARPSFFQNQDQVQQQHPPLKSETIQTFELNYISMFEPYCTINTSYFYNILNNLITRKVSPEPGDFAAFYTNGGKITTHGIEMTVQMYPTRQFQSEMSLVWQKSKDHRAGFENIDIAYSPHLLAYLKASYLYNRDISFSLTGKYVDDMKPHWDIIRQNPDGSIGGRIGHKVDAYYTIDLNCRISNILNKGYYINLNATNLFDEDFLYPTYVNNSNWEDKGTIGHERLIMLTVGRQF